jgi:hypothetical protein
MLLNGSIESLKAGLSLFGLTASVARLIVERQTIMVGPFFQMIAKWAYLQNGYSNHDTASGTLKLTTKEVGNIG